jgi:hypothetical protein
VIDELAIRDDLFFDIDDNHRAFAKVRAFGATHEKVFAVYDRAMRVHGSPSTTAVLRQYVALGVEHIATGYDHLAFLLALLVALASNGTRAGLRPALAVVTSFYARALRSRSPSPRSASCARRCATSRARSRCPSRSSPRWTSSPRCARAPAPALKAPLRAALGFGFGLVHGLGFAGALGELGLPRRAMVRALAAFNVGVELGQLCVAALVFPLLGAAARHVAGGQRAYERRVLAPISAALFVLGMYWFVQRIAAR